MRPRSAASRTEYPSADDPWMAAMRRGDFARAWEISDAHLRERAMLGRPAHVGPRHLQHIWNGDTLAGKRVLVRCYHGLGDTVQFIRLVSPLRARAREVTVWAQPALISLLRGTDGIDRLIPLHDGAPDVACDADIELMELAHALRIDAHTIPRRVPYLFPQAAAPRFRRGDARLAIGFVWQAGDWDSRRSIPPGLMRTLGESCGARRLSLQRGPAASDAPQIGLEDASSDDASETAATLKQLDLVVTVDTFVAHLAGALGVPVWLLLHADCDWRWMEGRGDSLWYPTMRLFRQPQPSDWRSVIRAVDTALRHHCTPVVSGRAHSTERADRSEQTYPSDVRLL